jgi:Zn-finger nucleic acid-binding protein
MTSYRESARRCPVCSALLDEQLHGGVHVDVCPDCAGVWIDWMDGELREVSAHVPRAQPRDDQGAGDRACPVCAEALRPDRHDGLKILRCGACAGAFVTRDSIEHLRNRASDEAPPKSADPFLTRLLDTIGRFVLPG